MALRGDGRGLLLKTISGLLGFAEPWNYKEFFLGGQISPATTAGKGDGRLLPQPGCTEGCPGHQNPRKILISAAQRWDKPFFFFSYRAVHMLWHCLENHSSGPGKL